MHYCRGFTFGIHFCSGIRAQRAAVLYRGCQPYSAPKGREGLVTFLSLKRTFLSLKLTFLSLKLTFLSLQLTFLSLQLTFLSLKLTFLSLKLTFLSLHLAHPVNTVSVYP
jgi:hypothetical protein